MGTDDSYSRFKYKVVLVWDWAVVNDGLITTLLSFRCLWNLIFDIFA